VAAKRRIHPIYTPHELPVAERRFLPGHVSPEAQTTDVPPPPTVGCGSDATHTRKIPVSEYIACPTPGTRRRHEPDENALSRRSAGGIPRESRSLHGQVRFEVPDGGLLDVCRTHQSPGLPSVLPEHRARHLFAATNRALTTRVSASRGRRSALDSAQRPRPEGSASPINLLGVHRPFCSLR
jgi:hypothetical protein